MLPAAVVIGTLRVNLDLVKCVVKWLEMFSYDAQGCRLEFLYGHPATGKLSVSPKVNRYILRIRGG